MDKLKRISGFIWLLLAAFAGYFLIDFGWPKLMSGKQDGIVFGLIILFILMPLIVVGLGIFGYYSIKGEYDDDKV